MSQWFSSEQVYASGPISALWSELSTAKWVAGTGIPLVVTVGSVAIAALLVRAQIRHDRRLISDQRKATLAGKLGWALREVGEYPDHIDGDQALTTERNWNPTRPVYEATRQASVAGLQDPNGAMVLATNLAREMYWRWRTAQRHAKEAPSAEERQDRANFMVDVVHTPQRLLLKLSERLIQWDGSGVLPSLAPAEVEPWTPVPLPPLGENAEAHQQWIADLRSEIEAGTARRTARRPKAGEEAQPHSTVEAR